MEKLRCRKVKIFLLMFLFFFSVTATAREKKENINLLSWWGYLDYPEIISSAEKECNVKITFDEYYSNDEFLRRWESQRDYYNVIIFSETIYNVLKNKLPQIKNSTLSRQVDSYNPIIKAHYFKGKYPHNIVYFAHAMTGFLWNSDNITITPNDSISSIFKKAKQKYVVIIDDPVEAKMLISASLGHKVGDTNNPLTIPHFKAIIQDAKIYITNNYSQIYIKPEFAFSYSWSGAAMLDLTEAKKNYNFLIHPKLSYISSDLLMQTSNNKGALCVSKFLTSKKIGSMLQNKYFYFSPYLDNSNITNSIFKNTYKRFLQLLPLLAWIDQPSESNFQDLNKSWQLIKLELNDRLKE